jgi:phenylacetate-CoA oxygenase PaaH subunit
MDNSMNKEWPIWEVFVRSKQGLDHKHCGSLHAADAPMALRMARDVYTRRQEGVSIWVVPSSAITASDAARQGGAVRTGWRQDLPPPDVLHAPRRSQPHVSAAMDHHAPTSLLRAASRGYRADPRSAQCRVVRPRPDPRRGHRAVEHEPRPDRPGAAAVHARLALEQQLTGASKSEDDYAYFPRRARVRQLHARRVAALRAACWHGACRDKDYAVTIVRNFLYSTLMAHLWTALTASTDAQLAAIAVEVDQGNAATTSITPASG